MNDYLIIINHFIFVISNYLDNPQHLLMTGVRETGIKISEVQK